MNIGAKLCDEVQMVEMERRTFIPFLMKGKNEGFVISVDSEVTGFYHMAKVSHGLIDCE
jgi:hypothetical protein